jgi:hypothetical protein
VKLPKFVHGRDEASVLALSAERGPSIPGIVIAI